MRLLSSALTPEDWKRGIALVILWSYGYQLAAWPPLWWAAATANAFGLPIPLPPLLPWELMMAGTGTLAAVGGIEVWRDRAPPSRHAPGPPAASPPQEHPQ